MYAQSCGDMQFKSNISTLKGLGKSIIVSTDHSAVRARSHVTCLRPITNLLLAAAFNGSFSFSRERERKKEREREGIGVRVRKRMRGGWGRGAKGARKEGRKRSEKVNILHAYHTVTKCSLCLGLCAE